MAATFHFHFWKIIGFKLHDGEGVLGELFKRVYIYIVSAKQLKLLKNVVLQVTIQL